MPKLSISRDEWLAAATNGDLARLEKWFKSGAMDVRYDPVHVGVSGRQGRARIFDVCSADKQNALYVALGAGQVDYALRLLDIGKVPATKTTGGRTAMHVAAQLRDRPAQVISRLVSQGYDLDVEDKKGKTPLLDAIEAKAVAAMTALLEEGATSNPLDGGRSPLVRAIAKSSPDMVSVLLAHGANPNFRDEGEWGATALHYLAACWDPEDDEDDTTKNHRILRMLVEAGADPEMKFKERNDKEMSVWDTFYRPSGAQSLRILMAEKQARDLSDGIQGPLAASRPSPRL